MMGKKSYSSCMEAEKRTAKMCGGKMHRDSKMYGGMMMSKKKKQKGKG